MANMMGWLDIDDAGAAVRLILGGPATTSQLDELLDAARRGAAADRDVEFDCRCVEQLGLGALQILAALAHELTQHGHALRILRASPALEHAIDLAGFAGALHIEHAQ